MMSTTQQFRQQFSAWLRKKLRRSPQTPRFDTLVERYGDSMSRGDYASARSFMSQIKICSVPDTFKPSAADKLYDDATQAEVRSDWPEAERLYRAAIALEAVEGNPSRGYWRIASLFRFLGRHRDAREQCLKAYELARSEPASDIMQAMSARRLAMISVANSDLAEDERILRSAHELIATDKLCALESSGLLAELAQTRLLQEDLNEARVHIDQAFAVIEQQRELHDFPGYQAYLARAWQVRATILQRSGDKLHAIDAWKRALECDRRAAEFDEDRSPIDGDKQSRLLHAAAEGISAAGDAELAAGLRAEFDRVREQWGLPAL